MWRLRTYENCLPQREGSEVYRIEDERLAYLEREAASCNSGHKKWILRSFTYAAMQLPKKNSKKCMSY